jgi:hypothetical protein
LVRAPRERERATERMVDPGALQMLVDGEHLLR